MLQGFLLPSKVSLRDLQSLLGLLSFACTVIIPGRVFLSVYTASRIVLKKPYYKVRGTLEAKQDLNVWLRFLDLYNGVTLYRTEMFLSPSSIYFYTDAAKSLGYGAYIQNCWFSKLWPSAWNSSQTITFLELIPIVLDLETWGSLFKDKEVIIHTDNLPLVSCINNQTSVEGLVMVLIRRLVLQALVCNIIFKAVHIKGHENILADSLSRLQVQKFHQLHPDADKLPRNLVPADINVLIKQAHALLSSAISPGTKKKLILELGISTNNSQKLTIYP